MDIGSSYTIKAIDGNIDITKFLDVINKIDDFDYLPGDSCLRTMETGGESDVEEVWSTARKIATCIPDVDFIIKGAVESFSDGQIDFFEITVKDKKIYSKHSGYVEPLAGDEFEDYEEFIEEYPDLETPFTEEEFESIGNQTMYITHGGFGAVVSEDNLPVLIDEMDL